VDFRGGNGGLRSANAPVVAPDGQFIYFTENPIIFEEGDFFTIQTMAGLPEPPAGRTVIGSGYNLVATAGAPVTEGSVSVQYLGSAILQAGVNEEDLRLYYWDGAAWRELETRRDAYYNLVSAPSQGAGIYALMASTPLALSGPGWNMIGYPIRVAQPVREALRSIEGVYMRVYGYDVTDTADPWHVYDPAIDDPHWENDLLALEFGQGYWIYVTEATTLYLGTPPPEGTAALMMTGLPEPPATYYGTLEGNAAQADADLEARIGAVVCGRSVVRVIDGQAGYQVDVASASEVAGCGEPGALVTFWVGDEQVGVALWDRLRRIAVAADAPDPMEYLYLPLVRR
jgi:hypothetical protein